MRTQNLQVFVKSPVNDKTLALDLDPTRTVTVHHLGSLLFPSGNFSPSGFSCILNGRPLNGSTRLSVAEIAPFSTFVLCPRLRGGGGDGGATGAESRDCYLNMYAEKKPDKVDPNEQRLSRWVNCALSNEPLTQPCVIDYLGNLFNKEALVEALLQKKLPKQFGHIKGLKDMVNIKLADIPGSDHSSRRDGVRFQCPITGLEFNGKYRFFALSGCGHVLSAKAVKEVKSSACLVCHKEFNGSDKIVINGSEEEVEVLRQRLEEKKARSKEKKAATTRVKNGEAKVANGEDETANDSTRVSGTKRGPDAKSSLEKALVKTEGNVRIENGKNGSNGVAVKKFKAADIAPPNATKEVYASIFTSSKKSDFKETFTCRSLPLGRN